ncbi:hypothetical protein [Stenotrophomonas geniculata]|uniref:hypothetical protein n=1 Tax=Stenotrophomonas geniculata TaxID=86188 RepID=UPI003D299CA3
MDTTPNEPARRTSIPKNLQLSLMGFPNDHEFTPIFIEAMKATLIECGEVLDLERLAGVTVGFDFDAALAAVDLGYESDRARQYTNNGEVVCVAKALRVLRHGKVMCHVVYNGSMVAELVDAQNEDYPRAIHIVWHELGHVAELKWRDEAMPGVLLQPQSGSWIDNMMRDAATTVWEEYSACRMTGQVGDPVALRISYAKEFERSSGHSRTRSNEAIKGFREHAEVDRLLVEAGEPILMPLKLAGYLLGHLDANEDASDLRALCPDYAETSLSFLIPRVWEELRLIWDRREEGRGLAIFDDLIKLVKQAYGDAGILLEPQETGYYVRVPFSAETMPNGEADMLMIRLQKAFGSW